MKLESILTQLATGEFQHLFTCDTDNFTILKSEYPKVIPMINLGLIELYKRFDIKTGEIFVDLYANITEYSLTSEYAQSNTDSTQIVKYINDLGSQEPFNGDLLVVNKVVNEYGDELPLGYANDPSSLHMLDYNKIQHPYPKTGSSIAVAYRAEPTMLPMDAVGTFEVNLAAHFLPALLLFVGSRVLSTRSSPEDINQGALFYNRFVQDVLQIESEGLNRKEEYENTKFQQQGWV